MKYEGSECDADESFNPLDRGNLNQINLQGECYAIKVYNVQSFNPLDRGNLNQIDATPAL